jgi:hypothetical protein
VRAHTSPEMLSKIDSTIEERIRFYGQQPREVLSRRIEELEREWDMERWLETNASTLALTGVLLGLTMSRKWLLVPGTVLSFLLLHAVHGWCPPVPLFRRLGIRTQSEIDRELYALKLLRGDADGFIGKHPEHSRENVDALARAFA